MAGPARHEHDRASEEYRKPSPGFVGGGSGPSDNGAWWDFNFDPLKHTDVVDLEVEASDSISSLEIVEPAHDVAEVFSTSFDPLGSIGRPPIWTGL